MAVREGGIPFPSPLSESIQFGVTQTKFLPWRKRGGKKISPYQNLVYLKMFEQIAQTSGSQWWGMSMEFAPSPRLLATP